MMLKKRGAGRRRVVWVWCGEFVSVLLTLRGVPSSVLAFLGFLLGVDIGRRGLRGCGRYRGPFGRSSFTVVVGSHFLVKSSFIVHGHFHVDLEENEKGRME